jgi:PAS domain S-box-containing protein
MLTEFLQDRAALYVSGDMAVAERESFEVILEFHQELRAQVAGLQETVAAVVMARVPLVAPPTELKARLLGAVDALPPAEPESLVATGPDGLVLWVNPAFTAMCGYTLQELRGRKPGHLLQGPGTDPVPVARLRESLRARQACHETLVNYHKDGTRYRVAVGITPVLDDEGQPLWFVARERKLPADEAMLTG